jgi:hypothetical protein
VLQSGCHSRGVNFEAILRVMAVAATGPRAKA